MGFLHALCIGGTEPSEHKEHGLNKENTTIRGCTDPIFLLVLLAGVGGVGYVNWWGAEYGATARLLYGVDSWDNICGFDNSVRLAADGVDCAAFADSSTCRGTDGCKWRGEFTLAEPICDPSIEGNTADVDGMSEAGDACILTSTTQAYCYHDLIKSSNAGLDMTNRKSQYYTDPSSKSAPILCIESCPTEASIIAADVGEFLPTTRKVLCNPTDEYCQQFCMAPPRGDASTTTSTNPYNLYRQDEANAYMTSNQDRGNCNDGGDVGTVACSLDEVAVQSQAVNGEASEESEISAQEARNQLNDALESAMRFLVDIGTDVKNAALAAAGLGAVDDWNTEDPTNNPAWETCKRGATADPSSTVDNAACANTGCPRYIHATVDFPDYVRTVYHPCVPSLFGAVGAAVTDTIDGYLNDISNSSTFQELMTSVVNVWKIIGYCMLISIVLSYVLIILMKFVIRPLIVVLCFLSFIVIAVLDIALWGFYFAYRDQFDALEDPNNAADSLTRNMNFFKWSARLWTVFMVIMFLVLIALRRKIWIAATLYMESSKAMFATPSMLISPIIHWVFVLGLLFAWTWVAILVGSSVDSEIQTEPIYGQGHVRHVDKFEYTYFLWFHIFMGLWGLAFFAACHEFVLAGCITNWYKCKGDAPNFAYFRSMWRLARYHLGTVALGSMIVAICQFIIAVLSYIQKKADAAGAGDSLAGYVLKACMCCMWCLEKCLKYINRNAYIETNLFGYSFCNAAMEAFNTLLTNFVQVAAHNFVGALVFFTLKIMVISLNMVIAYYWIKSSYSLDGTVDVATDAGNTTSTVATSALPSVNFACPMFIIALFTYFVVGAFTELLEMTTDTILICYCEDIKYNEAKKGNLLAPVSLLKALGMYKKNMHAQEEGAAHAKEAEKVGKGTASSSTAETAFHKVDADGDHRSPPPPGSAAATAPAGNTAIGNF